MPFEIRVLVNGLQRTDAFTVHDDETVGALDERLAAELSLAPSHRMLVRGKVLSDPTHPFPRNVSTLYVIESSEEAVAAVKAAKPDPLVRGFSSKPSKYAARPGRSDANTQSMNPYKFHSIRALPRYADKSKAEKLLETLANDPGFLRVMEERHFSVGCLAEMEPEGKVGVDPVCVLGLNVNKGQEILLRLRTDDKKGFRPMYMLKQVLAHELAHNVFSEHDSDFFDLMRKIEREAKQYDWRESTGHMISGASSSAASRRTSHHAAEGRDPLDVDDNAGPSLSIVQRLGSGPGPSSSVQRDTVQSEPSTASDVEGMEAKLDPERMSGREEASSDETESPSMNIDSSPEPAPAPLPSSRQNASRSDEASFSPTAASGFAPKPETASKSPSELETLMLMGFNECMAKIALNECGGDAERAADWLLNFSVDNIAEAEEEVNVGENGGTHVRSIELALAELAQETAGDPSQREEAFMTLYVYVRNLLSNPNNRRFREINGGNAAFSRRVGRFTAGGRAMRAIGYTLQDSGHWLLDGSVDIARVWVAKSLLVQTLFRHSREVEVA